MSNRKKMIVGAALAALLPASEAMSMPLINLRLLGRNVTKGDAGFSATVAADPGDSIEYRVVTGLAAIGNSNVQGATTRTISTKNAANDGVQSLKFNMYDPALSGGDDLEISALGAGTLNAADGWGAVTGAHPGSPTGGDLLNIRPGQAAGVYKGTTANGEEMVVSGSFSVDAIGAMGGFVRLGINQPVNINTSAAASARMNTGATVLAPTVGTEATTDPMIGLIPLNIVPIPEPASLGLLAFGGLALGRRRRTK
jgi:hypothetical protein